ncbi:MAG: hypothetical protein WD768_17670 [Phycisphaeraceae bacterium]
MMKLHFAAIFVIGVVVETGSLKAQSNLPPIVPDPSSIDWVVDRLAGNGSAGPRFTQGPAREVGGLGRCGACPLPDGRVLIPFSEGIAELDVEGTIRLVAEGRFLFPTTGQVTAAVMAYNPEDKHAYVAGPNCVRRLVEHPDGPWQVEVIAGTPNKPGYADGSCGDATFTRIDSIVINSRGTIFVLDGNQRIRRIEAGKVSTLNASVSAGPSIVDGPVEKAKFHMIGLGGNLCLGENDDVLYLSDHWNFAVRRIDLKANNVTTMAGMPKPTGKSPREQRFNANSDGPALTWASFNSGCAYVCWDPVHEALWCGGPDESRFRWLKDGEIRTVIGAKPKGNWPHDGVGVPAADVKLTWNAVVAVDAMGRVYLNCSELPNGLWRAYNRKEVKP